MRTSEQLIAEYQLVRKKRDENIVKYNMQLLNNTNKKRNKYPKLLSAKHKSYLSRAKSKQLEFTLTEEQFNELLVGNCEYCGQKKANGIDRIDSSQGYNLANSTSCCTKCNMMKYKYTREEFIKHVEKIYQYNAIK